MTDEEYIRDVNWLRDELAAMGDKAASRLYYRVLALCGIARAAVHRPDEYSRENMRNVMWDLGHNGVSFGSGLGAKLMFSSFDELLLKLSAMGLL